jgi:hypothetical protein
MRDGERGEHFWRRRRRTEEDGEREVGRGWSGRERYNIPGVDGVFNGCLPG